MEITTTSTEETKELARELAKKLKPGMVLALYGELGAGKTTFTRFLVDALNFDAKVQSPTFVIAKKYTKVSKNSETEITDVLHLDLYRIQSSEDLEVLDLDYFFKNDHAITVIEWPEIAEKFLPADSVKIEFKYIGENERKINVQNLH